jgi:hypothetical protein
LLRHEVTHVLQGDGESGTVFRAATPATGSCSWTCSPGTALSYVPVSDPSYNCYAYAVNSPGSGFLQPGQGGNTVEYKALRGDPAAIASLGGPAAATAHLQTHYFTPAGMRSQFAADLGTPFSPNCGRCCPPSRRKIIAVTTDSISSVGTANWDFHLYRKDADQGWSHKPGATPSTRNDASGAGPICSPCRANRSYSFANYSHIVGAWCV